MLDKENDRLEKQVKKSNEEINNYIEDKELLNKMVRVVNDNDENGMFDEVGLCQAIIGKDDRPAQMCINYVINFDIEEGRTRSLCYIREELELVII